MGIKFLHDDRNSLARKGRLKPVRIMLNEMHEPLEGDTIITLNGLYTPGRDELEVILNGIPQRNIIDYYEINEKTVQFVEPLEAKDIVQFIVRGAYVLHNREVFKLTVDTHVISMTEPYFVGGEAINVYEDGKMLTPDVDYFEEDEWTIRFAEIKTAGTTIIVHEVR